MKWAHLSLLALVAPVFSTPSSPAHKRCNKRAAATTTTTTMTTSASTDAVVPSATYPVGTSALTKTTATSSDASSNSSALATWIWNTTMIQDSAAVSQFFTFAAKNGMTRAYLHVDTDIERATYQSFISKCNASAIAVEALIGNAQWILGTGIPSLESNLEWISWYQANATSNDQKLSGIHMDVELWSLDSWESLQSTYIPAWQSMVLEVVALGKSLGLPVAHDLPFWAYTMTDPSSGETMDAWMLNVLDSATFMTYRNVVSELLDVAAKPLNASIVAGKPVWLAVETKETSEMATISFKGYSVSTLTSDLKQIAAGASSCAYFEGIAVHDYEGWLDMA